MRVDSYTRIKISRSFYSVGLGNIKRPSYRKLAPTLENSTEALDYLKQYRNKTWIKNILFVGGLGAMTGGILTLANVSTGKGLGYNEKTTPGTIAIIGGVMCLTVTYYLSVSRPPYLEKAIESYNRK
ncbi:MAG: hypothetical protein U0T82_11360 [Bacteroidales bacterium]